MVHLTTGGGAGDTPQSYSKTYIEKRKDIVGDFGDAETSEPAGADAPGTLAPFEEITPNEDDPVERLCAQLATAVGEHGHHPAPKVTAKWRTDMSLLLRRGPLGDGTTETLSPEKVASSIDFLFTHMAEPEGRTRFCWADQIRSPGALRTHWRKLKLAARRIEEARNAPPPQSAALDVISRSYRKLKAQEEAPMWRDDPNVIDVEALPR